MALVCQPRSSDLPSYDVKGYFQSDQSFKAEESNLLKMTLLTFNYTLKSEKIQKLGPAEL